MVDGPSSGRQAPWSAVGGRPSAVKLLPPQVLLKRLHILQLTIHHQIDIAIIQHLAFGFDFAFELECKRQLLPFSDDLRSCFDYFPQTYFKRDFINILTFRFHFGNARYSTFREAFLLA